eukprot:COSAG02_NODE_616_length_19505_cov_5.004998_14_plen_270_part_00
MGGADATLIRMTCRADGTLLKPTTPAMYIDRVWLGEEGLGEIATARTSVQHHTWAFTYRVCADTIGAYDSASNKSQLPVCNHSAVAVTAADIGLRFGASTNNLNAHGARYVAYRWCGSRPAGRCSSPGMLPVLQRISTATDSIMLAGNLRTGADRTDSAEGPQEADYWVAAPVLTNGWAILGEAEALVPVSSQRLLSFDAARDGTNNSTIVQMVVTGSVGETVTMLVADEFLVVYKVGPCVLNGDGKATMIIRSGSGDTASQPSISCVP